MRIIRILAAFVALGTVAFAVGDLASHPNPLGAVGILGLIVAFGFLLSFLFRPEGGRRKKAKPEPVREEPKPSRKRAPAAGVWADGWDAGEAETSRQRRRRK